ncbi:hypothetical protein HGRIS_000481 [Hohenbuehelia grisea]|uniref:WD40 repeat-like protein n=1 Tax=Hohenbuehelia grisea TaxID=104357 RepID=A0ABR3JRC3_9AGAR
MPIEREYRLLVKLTGFDKDVTSLLFARDGRYLLSGGKDEVLRVWDLRNFKCIQHMRSPSGTWGSVECLTWTTAETHPTLQEDELICFGTATGRVCLASFNKDSGTITTPSSLKVFSPSDPVETIAFDRTNHRLLVGSFNGQVRMYNVKTSSTLEPLWGPAGLAGGICRSFRFLNDDQAILFVAEAGEMRLVNATTGGLIWRRNLASAIGNVTFSVDLSKILVNNLNSGMFDVYDYPQENPLRTLVIPSTRPRLKQGLFAEDDDAVAICGSDHSTVYVFNANTANKLVQSLAYYKAQHDHLLASGSDGTICVWQKARRKVDELPLLLTNRSLVQSQGHDPSPNAEEELRPSSRAQRSYRLNAQEILLFLILVFVSHQQLYRAYVEASVAKSYSSFRGIAGGMAPLNPQDRPSDAPHDSPSPVIVTPSETSVNSRSGSGKTAQAAIAQDRVAAVDGAHDQVHDRVLEAPPISQESYSLNRQDEL